MTVAKLKAVVVLCLLAATAYSAYRYRFRLDAFAWHVLHGSSTTVGGYRVEVPQDWFVEQDSPNDAQLWNARTGESVWVHSSPKPAHFSLQLWSELIRSRQNRPENRIIAERTLRVAGEPFLCFERDYVPKLPSAASAKALTHTIHLPGVECESAGPLQVMFFGGMWTAQRHDYRDFYSLIASIQKSQ